MFHVVFFKAYSARAGSGVFLFYKNGINLSTYATIYTFNKFEVFKKFQSSNFNYLNLLNHLDFYSYPEIAPIKSFPFA